MATSYSNPCGSGDRRSLINITVNPPSLVTGSISNLINGTNDSNLYFTGYSTSGNIVFDFKELKKISEITFTQSPATTHGLWSWQGSNDNAIWEDIKTGIPLGNNTTSHVIPIENSSKAYRYYRLLLMSGATSSSPYLHEINFKIGDGVIIKYLIQDKTNVLTCNPSIYGGTLPTDVASLQVVKTIPEGQSLNQVLTKADIDTYGTDNLDNLRDAINLFPSDAIVKPIMYKE